MKTEFLKEIGEWAAFGYYEMLDKPWPRSYGRAMRRMYENMAVNVPKDKYLIPCEPFCNSWDRESHNVWAAVSLIVDFHHHSGLRVSPCIAEEKKKKFPQFADKIDELVRDLTPRFEHFGGYTHSNPDCRRVVDEGFLVMEKELDEELAQLKLLGDKADEGELNLLLSLKDYTTGVKAYHKKIAGTLKEAAGKARGARKKKLALIADEFANCFLKPSHSFIQGLLAVNFTWMLDGCDSIGRFDQVLGRLFESDIERNRLDIGFARSLLDELWQAFERLNAWNMQIGGYTPEGVDGCNLLTNECLFACRRNKLRRPNVALRITENTPDDLLVDALITLREGSGRPALYNDDLYVKTLYNMDLGLTEEDAREIGFGGCTETMIAGLSNVGSLEGDLNLAKMLELTLNDGFDPVTNEHVGPHTGKFTDFKNFDSFLNALKRQIQYATDAFVSQHNEMLKKRFTQGDPKLYRTFFTRDCVKNRKSFEAGGARYNWTIVSYHGIANLIDSIAAIRKCVYEDKTIRKDELIRALRADFKGFKNVRGKLLNVPKFGNDISYVDDPGAEIIRFAWEELYQHPTPRGGRYIPSCILFVTYMGAGKTVGATPDGRKAFEVLTDSVGASQGCDINGPTALIKSVNKLPLTLAIGTPVLNIRLQKAILDTEQNLQKVANLIRTFFSSGGLQIQISVLNHKEMIAAQKEPEKHKDLIVRIGGYSEYFNILDKKLQDSVIARTEHGV